MSGADWDAAQHAERIHWSKILGDPAKVEELFRTCDWDTQTPYFLRLAKWIGVAKPDALVVDVGCGPIGLAPLMRARKRVGIDPLAQFYMDGGVKYERFGYAAAGYGRAETAIADVGRLGIRSDEVDIVLCCNVLDHVGDLKAAVEGIAGLGKVGTEALVAYDLRTAATTLHPRLVGLDTVPILMGDLGWDMRNQETLPAQPWHVNESAGVRIEHYRRTAACPFETFRERVKGKTTLGYERLRGLYDAVTMVNAAGIPGDIVECGCWRGGSAAMLGPANATRRRMWVFDSFTGMPVPTEKDVPDHSGNTAAVFVGACCSSRDEVAAALDGEGLAGQYTLVKGLFCDTLPSATANPVAVLHLDCDWYESLMQCLEAFYDRVPSGGVIQIDDYGHWPGAKKATDDFLAKRGVTEKLHVLDYTGRQLWKP